MLNLENFRKTIWTLENPMYKPRFNQNILEERANTLNRLHDIYHGLMHIDNIMPKNGKGGLNSNVQNFKTSLDLSSGRLHNQILWELSPSLEGTMHRVRGGIGPRDQKIAMETLALYLDAHKGSYAATQSVINNTKNKVSDQIAALATARLEEANRYQADDSPIPVKDIKTLLGEPYDNLTLLTSKEAMDLASVVGIQGKRLPAKQVAVAPILQAGLIQHALEHPDLKNLSREEASLVKSAIRQIVTPNGTAEEITRYANNIDEHVRDVLERSNEPTWHNLVYLDNPDYIEKALKPFQTSKRKGFFLEKRDVTLNGLLNNEKAKPDKGIPTQAQRFPLEGEARLHDLFS